MAGLEMPATLLSILVKTFYLTTELVALIPSRTIQSFSGSYFMVILYSRDYPQIFIHTEICAAATST